MHWYGGVIDLLSYSSYSSSPITIQCCLYQQSMPLMMMIIAGINVCSAGLPTCRSRLAKRYLSLVLLGLNLRLPWRCLVPRVKATWKRGACTTCKFVNKVGRFHWYQAKFIAPPVTGNLACRNCLLWEVIGEICLHKESLHKKLQAGPISVRNLRIHNWFP